MDLIINSGFNAPSQYINSILQLTRHLKINGFHKVVVRSNQYVSVNKTKSFCFLTLFYEGITGYLLGFKNKNGCYFFSDIKDTQIPQTDPELKEWQRLTFEGRYSSLTNPYDSFEKQLNTTNIYSALAPIANYKFSDDQGSGRSIRTPLFTLIIFTSEAARFPSVYYSCMNYFVNNDFTFNNYADENIGYEVMDSLQERVNNWKINDTKNFLGPIDEKSVNRHVF